MSPAPRPSTHTRATDPDGEGRVANIVRATWFGLVTPGLLSVLVLLVGALWSTLSTKIESLDKKVDVYSQRLSTAEGIQLVTQAKVSSLEDTRAQRNAEVAAMRADITDLKIALALMHAGVPRHAN